MIQNLTEVILMNFTALQFINIFPNKIFHLLIPLMIFLLVAAGEVITLEMSQLSIILVVNYVTIPFLLASRQEASTFMLVLWSRLLIGDDIANIIL